MARPTVYETHFALGARVQPSVRKSFAQIQKNTGMLSKGASKAQRAYKGLGRTLKTALGAVGVYFSGRAIVSALNSSTNAAMEFQDQMADVATLLDGNVSAKIAKYSGQTKNLAIQTGLSTEILNKGLYETISAIGETSDTYNIFAKASQNARAGNVEVNESVKFLSAVMKGYGDISIETAQKVSDLGFQTVKLGQTTFPEMAANMGKVIPLASSMGAKMESVFGAMATLTGVTGNTAEVSTQLRGVFKAFVKPSADMQKAIQSLGFSSGKAFIETKGLQGALNLLNKVTGGSTQKMGKLFGEVEALNAVLALTGAQADNFTKKTKAMNNSMGISDKTFEAKIKTSKALRERFDQLINVIKITAGNKLLPKVNKSLEFMLNNYEEMAASAKKAFRPIVGIYNFTSNNWGKIEPIIVGVTGALVAYKTVSLALIAVEKKKVIMAAINKAFSKSHQIMNAYRTSTLMASKAQVILNLAMSANPAAVIAIAIGALVTAGYLLYKNWDKISKWWTNMWSKMGNAVNNLILTVKMGVVKLIKFIPDFLLPDSAKEWSKKVTIEYESRNAMKAAAENAETVSQKYSQNTFKNKPFKFSETNSVPMLAKGTNNFAGGFAIVGEQGPELINMPQGTQVTPNNRTEEILHLTEKVPSKAETLLKTLTNNTTNNKRIDVNWSPQIIIKGNANKEDVKEALIETKEDFRQMLIEVLGYDPRTSFA